MPGIDNFGLQISQLVTGFVSGLLELVFGLVATILTTVGNAFVIAPFS